MREILPELPPLFDSGARPIGHGRGCTTRQPWVFEEFVRTHDGLPCAAFAAPQRLARRDCGDNASVCFKLPISIFIIVFNESDRIARTIDVIRDLTDDVVVVDSGSTDGTQAISMSLGAKVRFNPWPGYGLQKRFGEDQCQHSWVLVLDADEVVSENLKAEIRALFHDNGPLFDAYAIRIAEVLPLEKKPRRLAYSHNYIRLYKKTAPRYSPSPIHDLVILGDGMKSGQLKAQVHHYSMRSIGEQLCKFNQYTDDQVADMESQSICLPTWRIFIEFQAAFLKAFFGRRHVTRGVYGYITAMNYAFFRYMRIAKHYECRRHSEHARPPSKSLTAKQGLTLFSGDAVLV